MNEVRQLSSPGEECNFSKGALPIRRVSRHGRLDRFEDWTAKDDVGSSIAGLEDPLSIDGAVDRRLIAVVKDVMAGEFDR